MSSSCEMVLLVALSLRVSVSLWLLVQQLRSRIEELADFDDAFFGAGDLRSFADGNRPDAVGGA